MAKAWLEERLTAFIPTLQPLGAAQEAEIEQLCKDELEAIRARPTMKKAGSIRPVITAVRNALKQRIKLTPDNRYRDPKSGEWWHLSLKYFNLTREEWDALNALSDEKFEARLSDQQIIEDPQAVIARAEKLLHSERWDDLVTGLAVTTGRRLTELLKSGRFFPKSGYTLVFDGQLKRRDLDLKPYEIPVLVEAELVLSAWRRLRSLEDTSSLDIDQVSARYSKAASETAVRHFTGIIPQRSTKEDLYTHGFRAVYARLAVLFFCPKTVNELLYVNSILGQYQAKNERQMRDFATTAHYFDYYVDGGQGSRLSEPGVQVLEVFQRKGDSPMTDTTTTQDETQEAQDQQQPVLETKRHKTRGTLTTKPGTFDEAIRLMEARNMQGTGGHDRLVVDLMMHDAAAHQMYELLAPFASDLDEETPVAILRALIAAYRNGGSAPVKAGMGELLQEVSDEKDPVQYLRGLVERDRKFKEAIANRHAGTDYTTLPIGELDRIKTTDAANERFRRAVDAIIAHNNKQQDPLHLWYINAAAVRDLVGGRNDAVQAYLVTRQPELDAHHKQYNLTPRQNRKAMSITDEITVQ